MHNNNNKYGDDSFWDIPSQKRISEKPHDEKKYSATPIEIKTTVDVAPKSANTETDFNNSTITRFVSAVPKKPNLERKLLLEYTPQNPFIKKVQIFTDNDADSIFARDNLFLRERRALIDRTYKEVPHVPFYSMMPRYSQMTRPQLAFYLWWRDNIRRGVWLECDISYVLLYAHELIASEDEDKDAVLRKLCELYRTQRSGTNISYYGIGNLIGDFCIIHDLRLPDEYLGDRLSEFMAYTSLPEFFIDISDRYNPSLHKKIMLTASVYNYKKSKHYLGNEDIFDKNMLGAVSCIFNNDKSYYAVSAFSDMAYGEVMSSYKPFFKISGMTTKQAKVKITYYPISFLHGHITDALRYTENKIREHLGIKAKLNVTTLNPDIRAAIDEYAIEHCPPMSRERKMLALEQKQCSEYDKLYEIPKAPLSLENAKDIEAESWQTTKKLVEAFEDERDTAEQVSAPVIFSVPEPAKVPDTAIQSSSSSVYSQFRESLGDAFEFLEYCIVEDLPSQVKYCAERFTTADEISEEINTAALNIIGDILLIECDGGYQILDDYKNLF